MATLYSRIATHHNCFIRSQNLTYYREAKKLNRRQAQWSLYLSEFDVKLVHTPGNKMVQSDALSRRPDLCPDEDNDNEDIIMLPDDTITYRVFHHAYPRYLVFHHHIDKTL